MSIKTYSLPSQVSIGDEFIIPASEKNDEWIIENHNFVKHEYNDDIKKWVLKENNTYATKIQ